MSIELKVGEWYETRGGLRLRVLADVSDNPSRAGGDCIVTIAADGDVMCYYSDGNFIWSGGDDENSSYAVVKHLPGCTGWDWIEEKWRDAKPSDFAEGVPVPCRVRDAEGVEWHEENVLGYMAEAEFPFIVHHVCYNDRDGEYEITAYRYCQILDQGAGDE